MHHRRSIRLNGYDYAQAGAYFVTLCTQNRENLFAEIVEGQAQLSPAGEMVQAVWNEMPVHYPGIEIAEFVVMPNHIHGIIVLAAPAPPVGALTPNPNLDPNPTWVRGQGRHGGPAPTGGVGRLSLPDAVHRFKTMTTKRYVDGVKQSGWPSFPGRLWQRNYWEHVIRHESEYLRISEYIQNNPAQWAQDSLNTMPSNTLAP